MANTRSAEYLFAAPDQRQFAFATLVDRLAVEDGHRVREVGPGHLVDQLAARAGASGVVVYGTGGQRARQLGPYDRIVVTEPRWDLSPLWEQQLAKGGRLLVLLRIRGGTHSILFKREKASRLRSVDSRLCMASSLTARHRRNQLRHGGECRGVIDVPGARFAITWDRDQPIDPQYLRRHLHSYPDTPLWTGVVIDDREDLSRLWLQLAAWEAGTCGLAGGEGTGFAPLANPLGTPALVEDATVAYLTRRALPIEDPRSPRRFELGVARSGPKADALGKTLDQQVRLWRTTTNKHVSVRVTPSSGRPCTSYARDGEATITRYLSKFTINA